jgi:hypothetical protein
MNVEPANWIYIAHFLKELSAVAKLRCKDATALKGEIVKMGQD